MCRVAMHNKALEEAPPQGGAYGRVRSWNLQRKRAGIEKPMIPVGSKHTEGITCIIGSLLCWGSKGRGSGTANERDYREADKHCQE
jgi:hypothetical protein